MSTIVTAADVVVRYNEQVVLNGATLAVEENDRVGLVGRNGCGKTTFLRVLAGLQTPDSGAVTKRRDLVVSYLSQDFTLDPDKTVWGNVRAGAQHVLDYIAEFEALPAESRRHRKSLLASGHWSVSPERFTGTGLRFAGTGRQRHEVFLQGS